jgi:hypothetical protein
MLNRTLNDDPISPTPLAWWRSLPADELELRDVLRLRRAMRGLQFLGEPRWSDAVSGDAADAIGIAIRVAIKKPCTEPIVDLVMSAVLGAAIEGDAGAQHFLAHMLRKRGAMEPVAESLAASWIAAGRAVAQVRRASKSHVRMRPPRSRRGASCGGSMRRR